ncbi:MAG: fluoride efflux transporter CrcB [Liquorilactobacillus nagelii]|jgi:CrcB protein|uniref:fluoride efflux transporter CrcB n=1 Tax=Liquorilactobacillus nagelii TaxID=82688 RepID=UPI00242F1C18|nr:fluoride efflux transporter CrcB [Liquorilactobacillus nagelii]MCI1632617.1 fluoride efflux transporter CrcB [Liquorilactobacillus nagelii]MCI1920732.1 fluoride efflux transporter CrcB [Liquorilactobacillus nagelii]MCI1977630.1 fluoride efflux transporter CrcB [Liquorilactobacillus nagelii]
MLIVLIGLGSSCGAICRYLITQSLKKKSGWPWATLLINLTGSFLLGFLFGSKLASSLYLILGVGVLGGYTTFSTLNVELLALHRSHDQRLELAYALASYLIGLLLAILGVIIGQVIFIK